MKICKGVSASPGLVLGQVSRLERPPLVFGEGPFHPEQEKQALEDAIHSAYDWISLELTEEEPDFPPVSDVADLGKSEGEIARNIAVNIRLFEGWDE